jgi:thiol:disulfide interchange protein
VAPDTTELRRIVREEIRSAVSDARREDAEHAADGIRWRRVADVSAVEAVLAEAKAQGRAALLDFTGPSCVNCQLMARTVFRLPAVIVAWNREVPILVNTDPPHDGLADWQQQRFATQARPLYVRIAPDGTATRWSEVFAPTDQAALARFLAFLAGGTGSDVGTGDGWLAFLLLALAGGLVTLVMPCTYPMIPFTLNVFAKQAAAGHRLVPLAAAYAGGIIACFVGLGVLVTGVFGANLATLAGHPLTNLLIALLFVAFGLSLLGVWFLRLPAGLMAHLGGSRAGALGALGMGLTFAVTAFTCTAPFAGTVLAQAVASGAWTRPVIGMAVYAGTIAVPFFLLALSPSWLARLPRAGAWMGELKVVGGLVELAAALKFLVIADVAWGWGVFGRDLVLACWAAAALGTALYLVGVIRLPGEDRIEAVGPWRLLIVLAFIAAALWLAAGLAGHDLGLVESFFPVV